MNHDLDATARRYGREIYCSLDDHMSTDTRTELSQAWIKILKTVSDHWCETAFAGRRLSQFLFGDGSCLTLSVSSSWRSEILDVMTTMEFIED